jgi:UDP-N-acetylmuramoyl-tripeptide--D-alanyl-D-alanine ligase
MPHFEPIETAAWTGGAWSGVPRPGRRIVHDSRTVRAGDWYVALRGEQHDGHTFLADAFARGATGAVVARGRAAHGPCLETDDPLAALADLARGHRARLRGRIVGITGSVGKSTVKEMAAAVLAQAGRVCRTPGNWNNEIGVPLSLLAMEPDDAWGVFELGIRHPGEMDPLCALVRPDWALMCRVATAHLEFFGSEAAIADEKAGLLRALPEGGCAVIASDEPWFDRLAASTRARCIRIALDGPADYRGRWNADAGTVTVEEPGGGCATYPLPVPGEHMARNALRAIVAGREAGLDPAAIAAGLAAVRLPPMRWSVTEEGGVRWINDAYNANPASMDAALRAFAREAAPGRGWLVLGGMRELGGASGAMHRALGRAIAGGGWAGLVCVGALAGGLAEGAAEAGWPAAKLARCADAVEAAAWLDARLRPGDAVLLKGSRAEQVDDVWEAWRRMDVRAAAR